MFVSRTVPRFLIAGVLAAAAATAWSTRPASAITGGVPDTTHHNIGTICGTDKGTGKPFNFCTGTLIHPRVFLTAGHVTRGIEDLLSRVPNWDGYTYYITDHHVSFSAANPLDRSTWNQCTAVITHPGYGTNRNAPDIGVLILKDPVRGIVPADLPPLGFLDRLKAAGLLQPQVTPFTVVGYGTQLQFPHPQILPEDGLRRIARSGYLNHHQDWLYLSQNFAAGWGGTGYGDSGGPAYWTAPDGTETLIGVTSGGDPNTLATGTYPRLDVPASQNFLKDVLRRVGP